ncbi:MAG: response regulator [Vitreimonas sp.]
MHLGELKNLKRDADPILAGGGEMGALMRAYDWGSTSLGPPQRWPQSLKTAVRIMLTSRQPIWIGWGEELIYLYNDPYRSIIGGKHPWALGKPTADVWSEIWPEIGPMLDTAMRGVEGTYVEEQLLIMERNGYPEETYYTFSYSPIPDDDGGVGGIICANTDDTQRVIGERQLSLLRELAARTSDARSLDDVCARAASALASDPQDITFAALYLADEDSQWLERVCLTGLDDAHVAFPARVDLDRSGPWPFSAVMQDHQTRVIGDLSALWPDLPPGSWRQASDKSALLHIPASGDGGRAGALVVGLSPHRLLDDGYRGFLDLAAGQLASAIANAQAYEVERRRVEALAELDRAKTSFFSNASHEFRTPLTLMLGPIEDLLRTAETEGAATADAAALSLIHRNGLRLLRLVNSLLDFSRIEAGRARASFEPLDLAALTGDLASSFQSAMDRAGLAFEVRTAPLKEPVFVDRDLWEKIVLNLISNAFKYTLSGSVRVTLQPADDGVRLDVSDTGVGISASELPRVFERFHRIEGQGGRTHEGTGIGLALVQELVRLHGGRVSATSELASGSTFSVWLPFGSAHLPPDALREPAAHADTARGAAAFVQEALRWLPGEENTRGERLQDLNAGSDRIATERVLLADDNADMRDYVRRLLAGAGYQVDVANDGAEALEKARITKPDLVLSDVMMPRLDGFELLRSLRADPDAANTPVILLSARAGEEATIEGRAAGADDYLVKPFSARELLSRVEAALKLAALRAETTAALRDRERQLRHANRALEQANALLADESEKLRQMFEQSPSLTAVLRGPDHRFELANAEYMRVAGQRDLVGRTVREAFPELEGQGLYELLDQVYATGEAFVGDAVPVKLSAGADGALEQHYINFVYQPIKNNADEVVGIFVDGYDVTATKRMQNLQAAQKQALELVLQTGSTAEALTTLVETIESQEPGMRGSVLLIDPAGDTLRHGAAPRLPTAYNEAIDGVIIGEGVGSCGTAAFRRELVVVEDIATDPLWKDFRELALSHGLRACWSSPIMAADGDILGTFAMYYDEPRSPTAEDLALVEVATRSAGLIIERKRAEERQHLLLNELNHRVKNSLATVQAVALQTFRDASSVEAANRSFSNRLAALAQSHDVLTRESWSGADLDEVVKAAVAPVSGGGRITAHGPFVRLNAKQALALSMAMHELATNAAKYGALSNVEGHCDVSWSFNSDRALILTWREHDGPPVVAPTRKGFGSRLIERGLAGELRAEVTLAYPREGVVCTINAKLEH